MNSTLAGFHDAFADALAHREVGRADVAALAAQPGFAVYRNTVATACIDALQANYPTVARLVGDEWFRAAAAIFAEANPPASPAMVAFGAEFPDFLAGFDPASELPYLAGVARLDRFWSEAHVAADAQALDPARISALAPDALAGLRLRIHPAARWAMFDEHPVAAIWQRHRDAPEDENVDLDDLDWHGGGMLVTRPAEEVRWGQIDAAAIAFLDACAQGDPLAHAASHALAADPDTDLAELMATLLDAGAFSEPEED